MDKNAPIDKDFRAFGVALVRRMTAATAAITLACLFVEMLAVLCTVCLVLKSGCTDESLLIKLW